MTKGEIHQLVHTLSYGDAISGEVRALRNAFSNCGYKSDIFTINTHPRYANETKSYLSLSPEFEGKIILHYSIGSPLNQSYLDLKRASRVLVYHNMTPAHWFYSINPRVAADLVRGYEELPTLCLASDQLVADSNFNAEELRNLGFTCSVLPLPVGGVRWGEEKNTAPNMGILSLLQKSGHLNLLHVGRIAPNKSIEDLLKVFYFLHHYIEKKSTLWLVGIDTDTEVYSFHLKRLAYELGIRDAVRFTGGCADEEVRAFYRGSSVYLGMSEHEGFCLPILEAMSEGLPVLAFDAGAVAETMGEAGILFKEKRHAEIAELVALVHRDVSLRRSLIDAGKIRANAFSEANFAKSAITLIESSTLSSCRRASEQR
jgi:glycosyltransferase involved in cell wall biosynthesis